VAVYVTTWRPGRRGGDSKAGAARVLLEQLVDEFEEQHPLAEGRHEGFERRDACLEPSNRVGVGLGPVTPLGRVHAVAQ
jgi:hypothetical protein